MRKALVTGANGGIGGALVEKLAREGYKVMVHARTEEKARAAAKGVHQPVWGDLAKPNEVQALVSQVQANTSKLDMLVHNAGVLSKSKEKGGHGLGLQGEVNVLAPAILTQALAPTLRKGTDPMVVIMSSGIVNMARSNDYEKLAEPDGSSLFGHYGLSKSAANRLTLDLAESHPELTVVSVEPGFVKSDMTIGNDSMPWIMGKLAPFFGATPEKAADRALDPILNGGVASGTVMQGTRKVESGSWTRDGAKENLRKLLWKAGVKLVPPVAV